MITGAHSIIYSTNAEADRAFFRDVVEAKLTAHRIVCDAVQNRGWGLLTNVTLPGGGKLGIYQPRHARPETMREK